MSECVMIISTFALLIFLKFYVLRRNRGKKATEQRNKIYLHDWYRLFMSNYENPDITIHSIASLGWNAGECAQLLQVHIVITCTCHNGESLKIEIP